MANRNRAAILTIVALNGFLCARTQVLTAEDSLYAGLISKEQATVLSGYGEAKYSIDIRRKTAEASLDRVVLFVGHRFNSRISLFTEMELEDAFVSGGSEEEGSRAGGEISMEQAFLKFNFNPSHYLVAGLFIPRIGFMNENHLPTTFNGVDRPFLEQWVIPSTWREIGVGAYGIINSVPGLNYSLSLTNGLRSAGFGNGTGIRNGRQLGSKANGLNLALSGSLLYYAGDFRLQASAYWGGSTAMEKSLADSLQLSSGPFGNPVALGEVNARYMHGAWTARVIGAWVQIPDAVSINKAFDNNTPQSIYGYYGELAYDLLYHRHQGEKSLQLFGRYEWLDLGTCVPGNGIANEADRQQYVVTGLGYKLTRGVVLKADFVLRITGEPNPAVGPSPGQAPYYQHNGFINLSAAYNF